MPSPIAHISVAYVMSMFLARHIASARLAAIGPFRPLMDSIARMRAGSAPVLQDMPLVTRLGIFGLCCFLSLIPDFDCVPAVFTGNLQMFHNFYSHSVFVLLGVSLIVAYLVKMGFRLTYSYAFMLTYGSCLIHVLMDLMCHGRGQLTFWPVSYERYRLPFTLFYGLRWSEGWVSFSHLITASQELAFAFLLIFVMQRFIFRDSKQ